MLAAALALCLQAEPAVRDALSFLVRHQAADGSWGNAPEGCACPRPAAPSPATDEDLADLGHDEVARRDAAQRRLEAAEAAALLRTGLEKADPEVRARARQALARVGSRASRDDVELTGLALLAFGAAGAHHRSRGPQGEAIQRGLRWLVGRQEKDGRFDPDPVGHAVATEAVAFHQRSWKSPLLTEPSERATAWLRENAADRGMALMSLRGLVGPARGPEPAGPLVWRSGVEAACGAVLFRAWAGRTPEESDLSRVNELASGPLAPRETLQVYGAIANVSDGSRWLRAAQNRIRSAPRLTGCAAGSWEGPGFRRDVESTASAVLVIVQTPPYRCRRP